MFPSSAAHYSPDVISKKHSPTEAQDSTLHFPGLSWYQQSLFIPPQESPCQAPCHPTSGSFSSFYFFSLSECINKFFLHSQPKPTPLTI